MCDHKRIRCTDNVFFCIDCGARIEAQAQEQPVESKPAKKRGGKGK